MPSAREEQTLNGLTADVEERWSFLQSAKHRTVTNGLQVLCIENFAQRNLPEPARFQESIHVGAVACSVYLSITTEMPHSPEKVSRSRPGQAAHLYQRVEVFPEAVEVEIYINIGVGLTPLKSVISEQIIKEGRLRHIRLNIVGSLFVSRRLQPRIQVGPCNGVRRESLIEIEGHSGVCSLGRRSESGIVGGDRQVNRRTNWRWEAAGNRLQKEMSAFVTLFFQNTNARVRHVGKLAGQNTNHVAIANSRVVFVR